MAGVRLGLDLERAVLDVEVLAEALAQRVEHPPAVAGGQRLLGDDDVRRQDGQPGGDRPRVQVVHVEDAVHPPHVLPDLTHVDPPGRGLEQHVEGVAQEVQGARQHQAADHDGGDGVGRRPAGAEDDERGDDDRDRSQRVGEHLQVGAADVERLRSPPVEHGEGHQVHDQPDAGDDEHRAGLDLRRVADPPDRLGEHEHRDGDEQEAVRDRGEDLDPLPAERASSASRPLGERDRAERQRDADRVGRHVPGVGEQGQGAGHDRADHLGHQHGHGEPEDDRQPASLPAGCRDGGMAVAVSHALPSCSVRATSESLPQTDDAPGRENRSGASSRTEGGGIRWRPHAPAATGSGRSSCRRSRPRAPRSAGAGRWTGRGCRAARSSRRPSRPGRRSRGSAPCARRR